MKQVKYQQQAYFQPNQDTQIEYYDNLTCLQSYVLYKNLLLSFTSISRSLANQKNHQNNNEQVQGQSCMISYHSCPKTLQRHNVQKLIANSKENILSYVQKENDDNVSMKVIIHQHLHMHIRFLIFAGVDIFSRMILVLMLPLMFDKVANFKQGNNAVLAYVLANLGGLLIFLSQFARHNALNITFYIIGKIKSQIIYLLFRKIQTLTNYTIQHLQIQKIILNLESDLTSIQFKLNIILLLVFTPILLAILIAMLAYRIGKLCLVVVLIIVISIFVQVIIAFICNKAKQKLLQSKAERLKAVSQIIQNIKYIKINVWQQFFQHKVKELRARQIRYFFCYGLLKSMQKTITQGLSLVISLISIYMIYLHGDSSKLSTWEIFILLGIFSFLKTSFGILCIAFAFLFEIISIFNRLNKVFNAKNIGTIPNRSYNDHQQTKSVAVGQIKFSNFYAYWGTQQTCSAVLYNINLDVKPKQFVGVVGKVGSGKTTFLSSIIKQIPYCIGNVQTKGKIAYVQQEPFIKTGSFRDNILFGQQYNKQKYENSLRMSCLHTDLLLLKQRDLTFVGEGGRNLSGGQKIRLSLARAIYSDADIYLLDDPMSGLDAKVINSIYEGILKLKNRKTLILATHHEKYLNQCDYIVRIDDGKIGIANVQKQKQNLNPLFENIQQPTTNKKQIRQHQIQNATPVIQSLRISHPSIFSYIFYAKVNYLIVPLCFIIFIVSQLLYIMFFRILSQFTKTYKKAGNTTFENIQQFWMGLYLISLGYILTSIIKYCSVYLFAFNSNQKMFQNSINKLINAPLTYFNENSVSDILLRLSDNFNEMEDEIITYIINCFHGPIFILIIYANVCITNYYFLIPTVISIGLTVIAVKSFEKVIIITKHLQNNAKIPVFSALLQLIKGLVQFRITNSSQYVLQQMVGKLNVSFRTFICTWNVFRIFAVFASYISAFSAWIGLIFGLVFINEERPQLFAVVVILFTNVNDVLRLYVYQLMQLQISKSKIQRVHGLATIDLKNSDQNYKRFGQKNSMKVDSINQNKKILIKIQNLSLRYAKYSGLVLKHINFAINKKQKIGIVGRTGAGKSSIFQVLLRLYQPQAQSRYFIEQQNALVMDQNKLRNNFAVITQTPFIFTGTILQNLDPQRKHNQQSIWQTLKSTYLSQYVQKLPNKLQTVLSDSSAIFSFGQKQLLCLARALLKHSQILLMDEATSNLDFQTDRLIQKCIRQNFKQMTIVTIAHRLESVADYDKIIVMENGEIVENGSPFELLSRQSKFSSMIDQLGSEAEKIRKIIKQSHTKKHNMQIL